MPAISETVHGKGKPPLRVGLVGVTGYAYAYFEEINKLVREGKAAWAAVTIINREAAPEQVAFFESAGIPIYDDYRDMFAAQAGQLDWVCLPTAIGWHTRMTVDALQEGFPVLLEKPIAPTLQDVDTIQAAEAETGLPVAIGYQHSYGESTWKLKQRLLEGVIGDIRRIDSICLWGRPRSYYNRNDWGGRLFVGDSWVLDSPLHNAISHVLNLILFFAGSTPAGRSDIRQVEAELYRAKPIQSYDTVRTEALLDSGARAVVLLSHSTTHTVDPEIRITGTKGRLHWRFTGEHIFEVDGHRETVKAENPIRVREHMFANIVRLLNGDSSARICSTEQAKGEVKWVNAVQDASAIHDIPERYRRTVRDDSGEVFDIVEGLDTYAMRAYRDHCWFKEAGAPWAVDPGKLQLDGYNAFQARKIPEPVPGV